MVSPRIHVRSLVLVSMCFDVRFNPFKRQDADLTPLECKRPEIGLLVGFDLFLHKTCATLFCLPVRGEFGVILELPKIPARSKSLCNVDGIIASKDLLDEKCTKFVVCLGCVVVSASKPTPFPHHPRYSCGTFVS